MISRRETGLLPTVGARVGPHRPARRWLSLSAVRLVIARCQVDYVGRLTAHLPMAIRLLMVKADGSVLVHSDGGSYKPLNWMSPPCRLEEGAGGWRVVNRAGEELRIRLDEVLSDVAFDLGVDPGLTKDGVEAHLQELLADQPEALGMGWRLVRREFPTAIGPVDLLCRDPDAGREAVVDGDADLVVVDVEAPDDLGHGPARRSGHVAVEVKRRATIDAVEQLSRYLDLLNRDPVLRPVRGCLAAQSITKQARTLAEDRGISCVVVDYDALRGFDDVESRLF